MEREKLIENLEKAYNEIRSSHKIKATLDDLDRIFFIKDYVLKDGFVSSKISRQIEYRIVEIFMNWNEYLHSLIMPNPQNILNMSESKILSQDEKKSIIELMKKIMELTSRNSIIGLTKDIKEEVKFIDDAVHFWEKEFKNKLLSILKKINAEWGKENENL
ncbi:MAG: hypothetical protein AABW50_00235 [Nanoarchaeota archaeon]